MNRAFDSAHIWHPYAKIPNAIPTHLVKSARGVWLTLENDVRVIDGMSSWWSAIHGYRHPALDVAVRGQLDKMAHVMFGGLTHQSAIDLAKILIEITPASLDTVFFADSGSVAVEVALKMALQYANHADKTKFITIYGGYHGDTFGAMSVCDSENGMHRAFGGMLAQHFFVKQPTLNNTQAALDDLAHTLKRHHQSIAAMILEPIVQGAGGMNIYAPEYLRGARALCTAYDVLLIVDEIATGFGRTGKLFACEYAEIVPDILCVGKALTGGYMTLAAVLTTDAVAQRVGVLMHGPTFMANPLACACAQASIKLLLNGDWRARVQNIERIFTKELLPLMTHPKVRDVRIIGAIAVIEMHGDIALERVQKDLIESGVWLRPFGRLLYALPPFIISDSELMTLTGAMQKVVKTAL